VANYFLPDPIASDSVFLETLNFYFMKTANIPVYGNVAVYALVCLKIDCTLRCSRCFTPLCLLIVKTLTNVLLTITYRGVVFSFQRCAIQSELQVI